MPPITAIASGCSIWEPAPIASESGIMPATVANAVIKMGRSRRSPASIMAFRGDEPSARKRWSASSSKIPFLATMPITMISPMKDEILNVVPVMSNARKTPEVDSSADAKIARGAANVRNSKSNTINTNTTASTNTVSRSRKDFCCSAKVPPYTTRSEAGRFMPATAACTFCIPLPRLTPSKRPVTATSRSRFSRRISVWPASF